MLSTDYLHICINRKGLSNLKGIQSVCYLSYLIYIVLGTGIADTLKEGIVALAVTVLVLHPVAVGYNGCFPVVKGIIAFGMAESEKIVVLSAEAGSEISRFEDCLGKDDLWVFDAVSLESGIEVGKGELVSLRLLLFLTCELGKLTVTLHNLFTERTEKRQWIGALPCTINVQSLKADVEVTAGAASTGADSSDDAPGLNRHALFGINLTEVTIETSHGAVVQDDVVAVTGVAMLGFNDRSR